VLPDATSGGGRSALGDGDLQTREDMKKCCKEKCLDGLRRCAKTREKDWYQKRTAASPGAAGFDEHWRRMGRALASYCVGLAVPQTGEGEGKGEGGPGTFIGVGVHRKRPCITGIKGVAGITAAEGHARDFRPEEDDADSAGPLSARGGRGGHTVLVRRPGWAVG
jgi:hypothetical protein